MPFNQALEKLVVKTSGAGLTDITASINEFIKDSKIKNGLINITALHTSCSMIINENADIRVQEDLATYLNALVPYEGVKPINGENKFYKYKHSDEGLDDMPAHIKTALTNTCLTLSIEKSKLLLGTWQAIYLWEHRSTKHIRTICLHIIGESEES